MNIVVIGGGTMGHGIAQQAAVHGFPVAVVDQAEAQLDLSKKLIREHMASMKELGLCTDEENMQAFARITFTSDLEAAARQADFVFEAVFEDLKVKQELYAKLGDLVRQDVILASNTSSFDIDSLVEVTTHPERVIGAHWFHPPQITPCVELVVTKQTSQATLDKAMEVCTKLGKFATRCTNAPAFVANRIQMALFCEACALVDEGLATPEEIDRIVKSSFGFRIGAYGPFEIADQAGLEIYAAILDHLSVRLNKPHWKPAKIVRDHVAAKEYGLKTGKGFYDYSDKGPNVLRAERNKKFYDRLAIFNKENF